MEWLNFRHLYAFWAVCRSGGFRKASERIFVSQSTVSEQVALLEEYLGETLLTRNSRSVTVTDRGAALLAYAEQVFATSTEINHIFRDKRDAATVSSIRVGMVGGISRNFIFRLILGNLGIQVDVVDGSFDELSALLRSFDLDLIFSLDRPRHKDMLTVSHKRVESSPLALVGSPALIDAVVAGEPLERPLELYLFRHPVEGAPVEEAIAARFGVEVVVRVVTDDISLLRFLANGGRGLAVVPEIGVKEDLDARRVAQIALDGSPTIDMFAIFLTKGTRREIIDAFV